MNFKKIFLTAVFVYANVILGAEYTTHRYRNEFKVFTKSSHCRDIFDKEFPDVLRQIQRDVENFKELSEFQRLARFMFFALDVVVITPATMPGLYEYIDSMCQRNNIKTPTIFITRDKGFFNAAAAKILTSSGGIVIGQKLLLEVTDQELEAVLAHEIGHIKYNHVNKMLGISFASHIVTYFGIKFLIEHDYLPLVKEHFSYRLLLHLYITGTISQIIVNKSFERQADAFAYKEENQGPGLIKLFERLETKEESSDIAFAKTYEFLQNNKQQLSSRDYRGLIVRYYLARLGDYYNKAFRWLYYNTPFGPHPSPAARISTIRAYLENEQ